MHFESFLSIPFRFWGEAFLYGTDLYPHSLRNEKKCSKNRDGLHPHPRKTASLDVSEQNLREADTAVETDLEKKTLDSNTCHCSQSILFHHKKI